MASVNHRNSETADKFMELIVGKYANPSASVTINAKRHISAHLNAITGNPDPDAGYLCSALELSAVTIDSDGNQMENNVLVYYYVDEDDKGVRTPIVTLSCGNALRDGSIKADTFDTILKKFSVTKKVESEIRSKYVATKRSSKASCRFWRNVAGTTAVPSLCEHSDAACAWIRDNYPDLVTDLEKAYVTLFKINTVNLLSVENFAYRIPVLIEGDRGAGKTVEAREFGKTAENYIEMPGHESVESSDLIGHFIAAGPNEWAWKDGPLASAFRSASKGIKTVLVIEEMLRIPKRQLSVLLTALAPTLEGTYKLPTDRVIKIEDGIAETEKLECKVSNLAIIATTNVGAKYAVEDYDPAIMERFYILRSESSEETIKKAVTFQATAKNFSSSILDKMLKFFKKMKDLENNGLVNDYATTRAIANSIYLANEESDIPVILKGMYLQWVARDTNGIPIPEQVVTVGRVVDEAFK